MYSWSTQGPTVSTYTVYSDNTAIEELDTAGVLDYKFYFADSSTRTAAYQAQLLKTGRQLTAEFRTIGGAAAGTRPVTQAYNPYSSLNLDFDNPTPAGRSHMQVTKPALYSNVNGVLFSSYNRDNASGGVPVILNLDVFKRSDNSNYIVVHYDAAGNKLYENTNVNPDTALELYNNGSGTVLRVLSDATLRLIEPQPGGSRTFAINANGMVVQKKNYAGTLDYYVHLMNTNTGVMQFSALTNLYAPGNPTMTFYAPINQTFSGTYSWDLAENPIYQFDYNFSYQSTTYSGTVQFILSKIDGEIIKTYFVHY